MLPKEDIESCPTCERIKLYAHKRESTVHVLLVSRTKSEYEEHNCFVAEWCLRHVRRKSSQAQGYKVAWILVSISLNSMIREFLPDFLSFKKEYI